MEDTLTMLLTLVVIQLNGPVNELVWNEQKRKTETSPPWRGCGDHEKRNHREQG